MNYRRERMFSTRHVYPISKTLIQISRPYSSSSPNATTTITAKIPSSSIYISKSTNPYFNLSFEDWLFRHKPPEDPLLLIYRDEPCVVIGRNQNPWKEMNMSAHRRTGIPFIRRRSGGGTVYHDLGNTNFSIHLSRQSFDRHATAQVVLRAVRSLGIDAARVNERNDICVGEKKMTYKIVNNRAYHHGTMLISTQLDTLGDLLRTDKENMITKGVASVRSPVCNLRQFRPDITHEAFAKAVVNEFRAEYGVFQAVHLVNEHDYADVEYIRNGIAELPSWEWSYGQTPEFTYTIQKRFPWGDVKANIRSKHGLILSCLLEVEGMAEWDKSQGLSKALERKRYGFVEEGELGVADGLNGRRRDVWEWLKRVMSS